MSLPLHPGVFGEIDVTPSGVVAVRDCVPVSSVKQTEKQLFRNAQIFVRGGDVSHWLGGADIQLGGEQSGTIDVQAVVLLVV